MAVDSSSTGHSKAAVRLKFIVVGGSIAGLATGYALKNAGHDVLIVEAGDGKAKSQGGLQSTPNMTKILYSWGLQPALDRLAHKCKKFIFRNGGSGAMIGTMKMDENFLADLVADFLFIQHQDLKDMVYDLAVQEGARIMYQTRVQEIRRSPKSASVSVDTGEVFIADVVVVADGYNSCFRPLVTDVPDEETVDRNERHLHITLKVPVDSLLQDEEWAPLLNVEDWLVWMGSRYVMHANLTNGGKDLTATMTYTYDRDLKEGDDSWRERPLDYWALDLDKFESRPRKLLELVKIVSARVVCTRLGPEELVGDQSKVVLVGEAAHPLLPGGNHRTALTFEDAHTLGCLFSRIQHRDQISHFLTAYEDIRHPRCEWTHAYDNGFHAMAKAPAGPEMDGRDALLTETLVHGDWDHMDETLFRAVWGDELSLYTHDAAERVEDWWGQWGSLIEVKGRKGQHDSEQGAGDVQMPSMIPGLHRVSISSTTGISGRPSFLDDIMSTANQAVDVQ